MTNSLYKAFFSLVVVGFLFIVMPIKSYADTFNNIDDLFLVSQQKTIINYEKSQPSSIDNPVVDPNFNAMRAEDTENLSLIHI